MGLQCVAFDFSVSSSQHMTSSLLNKRVTCYCTIRTPTVPYYTVRTGTLYRYMQTYSPYRYCKALPYYSTSTVQTVGGSSYQYDVESRDTPQSTLISTNQPLRVLREVRVGLEVSSCNLKAAKRKRMRVGFEPDKCSHRYSHRAIALRHPLHLSADLPPLPCF